MDLDLEKVLNLPGNCHSSKHTCLHRTWGSKCFLLAFHLSINQQERKQRGKGTSVLMGRSVPSWNVQREFPCFLKVQIDVSDLSNSVSEIMIKLWSCLACGKVPTDMERERCETMTYEGGLEQKWDEVLPPASLQSLLWGGMTVHNSGLCFRLQM